MTTKICMLVLVAVLAEDRLPLPDRLERDALIQAKSATVLVCHSGGSGSGFFVNRQGYLITNRHVVEASRGGEISVVIHSGEDGQKTCKAAVVALDDADDLALLHVEVEDATPLTLGDPDELTEADSLWAYGYPLGNLFAQGDKGPSVTVNRGSVTALRKGSGGELEAIQTDAQVSAGNSGGPLASGDGRVYGVIVAEIRDTNLRFAIPASSVRRFVGGRVTQVLATPGALPDAGGDVGLEVRVFEVVEKCDRVWGRVEDAGVGEEVELKRDGDRWVGTWKAPGLDPAERGAIRVTTRSREGKGTTSILALREVSLTHAYGKLAIPAADLVRIRFGEKDARDVVETAQGVLQGRVAERTLGLDVEADSIAEASFSRPEGKAYTIAVRARFGLKVVKGPQQTVRVGAPTAPAAPAPAVTGFETKMEGDQVEKKTPGRIGDVKLAAGGRLLAVHFKELKTIGLFDLERLEFVKQLPLAEEDVLFAAGRSALLVTYPKRSLLVRWNLATLEKDLTVESPIAGTAQNLEMGWNSDGPAVLRWSVGTGALDQCKVDLLDVVKLGLIPQDDAAHTGNSSCFRDKVHMRASADGRTLGIWCTSHSPSGIETMRVGDGRIEWKYKHDSVGYVVPSDDGSCLYTQAGGIYSSELKGGSERNQMAVLPAPGGVFYLSMTGAGWSSQPSELRGSIHLASTQQKLLTLDFPILATSGGEAWVAHDFTLDKRVFVLPSAKVLVTIPESNDRIVIRRLDVDAALEAAGTDYLYVVSSPSTDAAAGTPWEYAVRARSKRGGVKFKLESGPEGMMIEPDGTLRWTPAATTGSVPVIVLVTDASGQEVYHTFRLNVR